MRSKDFKQRAKEALKGHWFKAIVVSIIASLFGAAPGFTFSYEFSVNEYVPPIPEQESGTALLTSLTQQLEGQDSTAYLLVLLGVMFIGMLFASLFTMFIRSIVSVGYAQFNLDLIDGSDIKIRTLFSRTNQFGVAFRSQLLIFVRVFFGTVFFIIPGIVMAFSYAMTDHVLADNPDMNAREALAESRRIMRGNRWRLFCLSLSFIGLCLVCVLTLGIGYIWAIPYMQATVAAFYREAKANA